MDLAFDRVLLPNTKPAKFATYHFQLALFLIHLFNFLSNVLISYFLDNT